MKVDMLMPQMGESIAEATILKWLKNVGDTVGKDETILEISTDKVDSEIPAPASGILVELKADVGQTVAVKSVIAIIDTEGGAAAAPAKKATPAAAVPSPAPAAMQSPVAGAAAGAGAGAVQVAAPVRAEVSPAVAAAAANGVHVDPTPPASSKEGRFYSPLVRSLANQNGLSEFDLSTITGSGTHGRVTKDDVLAFLETRSSAPAPVSTTPVAAQLARLAAPTASAAAVARPDYGTQGVRLEPMDNMRKRISEHMTRSKSTSAHVYTMNEVDVSTISKWREKQQKAFQAREGFKLSFTPFFLEATVKALMQFPYINASIDGENIVLKRDVNLGCAVALGTSGLIVPVIKSADQLNFVGLARSLNDIAFRARNKQLKPDDIQGGTFTVTNPGIFGSIMGCPIINQPQLAILGVGAIKKRPVVIDDMIAIREMCYLTLSYDHRLIDGSMGGQFLNTIAKYLESWDINRDL